MIFNCSEISDDEPPQTTQNLSSWSVPDSQEGRSSAISDVKKRDSKWLTPSAKLSFWVVFIVRVSRTGVLYYFSTLFSTCSYSGDSSKTARLIRFRSTAVADLEEDTRELLFREQRWVRISGLRVLHRKSKRATTFWNSTPGSTETAPTDRIALAQSTFRCFVESSLHFIACTFYSQKLRDLLKK